MAKKRWLQCLYCGRYRQAIRSDASTCSNRCAAQLRLHRLKGILTPLQEASKYMAGDDKFSDYERTHYTTMLGLFDELTGSHNRLKQQEQELKKSKALLADKDRHIKELQGEIEHLKKAALYPYTPNSETDPASFIRKKP